MNAVTCSLSVSGMKSRNSSPPRRHTAEFCEDSARSVPRTFSALSPALCPWISLIFFRLSISMKMRHPLYCCMNCAVSFSPLLRIGSPVRKSKLSLSSCVCSVDMTFETKFSISFSINGSSGSSSKNSQCSQIWTLSSQSRFRKMSVSSGSN